MTDFLKDYYFNGFFKGRKNFVLTPRYAKKLPAMRHSAESRLRPIPHSGESRLRAMPHSVESRLHAMPHIAAFKKKVLSATPRYATQCEIQVKNFLVDSALCGTAGSRLCTMPHSVESLLCAMRHSAELESRLPAMRRSAESIFVIEYLREFESICKTVLAHESGGYSLTKKNRGSKIS
jgi:hypothetical protein